MGRFVKGEVVVLPFPFSDLSGSKLRPALVLADLSGDDIILCQITSQMSARDGHAISLEAKDFQKGNLKVSSNIRPNRIFTADKNIIKKSVGVVERDVFEKVVDTIIGVLKY
jgi:mRNA interferase MazF